jgi:transposase
MSLSIDLRTRIIKAYEIGQGSIRQLAKQFQVGEATVWRLVSRYRKEGEIRPKVSPGRKRKLNEKNLSFLRKLIHKKNDMTLEELREALSKQSSLKVGIMTIHRACERLNLRYKKNAVSSRTTTC